MWSHARLLRTVLLVSSVLTLNGLHLSAPELPCSWQLARLLPLTALLLPLLANTAYAVTASSPREVFSGLAAGLGLHQALLVLLVLWLQRQRLVKLLTHAAELERDSADCRRRGDHSYMQRQAAMLVMLAVCSLGLTVVKFVVSGKFYHPLYLLPMVVPEVFRTASMYPVLIGLQAVGLLVGTVTQLTFDLVFLCLMDACSLHLGRISCMVNSWLGEGVDSLEDWAVAGSDGCPDGDSSHLSFTVKLRQVAPADSDRPDPPPLIPLNMPAAATNVPASARYTPPVGAVPTENPAAVSARLHVLRQRHSRVRRQAAEAAALCCWPALGLHAAVAAHLLLGCYLAISSGGGGVPDVLLMSVSVLRLMVACCAGTRLLQHGQALHDALTSQRWPPLTAGQRLNLLMMVERARQPPTFDAWGLFNTEKTSLVSMFGFVLTYCVIMIQMVV